VNEKTLKNDSLKYNRGVMHWKPKDTKKSTYVSQGTGHKITRPSHLPSFIMDTLVRYSEKKAAGLVADFKQAKVKYKKHILDEDLVAPWREAEELARLRQERGSDLDVRALDEIRKHVERLYEKHRTQVKKHNKSKGTGGASAFTDLPIEVRQNQLRDMSKEFASYPSSKDVLLSEEVLRRLRASYAYLYDYERNKHREAGFTRFPWDVSMGELCAIKAAAVGRSKTVAAGFYERFFLKGTRR
jgi:RNA-dependent RNA polymerase